MKTIDTHTTFNFEQGETLLVNKPLDWTSFDVVNKIRYSSGIRKVGHAGTLDPRASGLLIVCIGRKATRQIDTYQGFDKVYEGSFYLGARTASFDAETEILETFDISHITAEDIVKKSQTFLGVSQQVAPIYSALKVNGTPMYKSARKGIAVKPKTRMVRIEAFDITKIELPYIHFRIHCGKGTYIRSIANDLGEALGVGAYLASLRRTKIGEFDVKDAWELPILVTALKAQKEKNKKEKEEK
ncbi:MAG: tRNA pseudouridine(55) synthase TruB [Chitinophagales bacterium]